MTDRDAAVLTYARHEFRHGGYLSDPEPTDRCVWRVDGHSPYCGIVRTEHDDVLAARRGGTWRWPVPEPGLDVDGDLEIIEGVFTAWDSLVIRVPETWWDE